MWIRFLQDYRGKLTQDMHFHCQGQEVDMDAVTAAALIAEGRACAMGSTADTAPGNAAAPAAAETPRVVPSTVPPARESTAKPRRRFVRGGGQDDRRGNVL